MTNDEFVEHQRRLLREVAANLRHHVAEHPGMLVLSEPLAMADTIDAILAGTVVSEVQQLAGARRAEAIAEAMQHGFRLSIYTPCITTP